jgi:HAD superfamily hydrolase (TIGR01509 family)
MRAVIFDLDGVVADSIDADFGAWKRLFAEHGKDIAFSTYKEFSGMHGREIAVRYLGIAPPDAMDAERRKESYVLERVGEIRTPPGLREFLADLRRADIRIALATAAGREKAEAVTRALDVRDFFEAVVASEDTGKGKPDPAPFLLAAEKLGVPPHECVVIEDAPNGIAAATRAGMASVGITTTHTKEELAGASKVIASFRELDAGALQALRLQ